MGVTDPLTRPAEDSEDDHAIVLEATDFMLKIETLTEEQCVRLQDIQALVDRRQE
jgi:hypothetical protein